MAGGEDFGVAGGNEEGGIACLEAGETSGGIKFDLFDQVGKGGGRFNARRGGDGGLGEFELAGPLRCVVRLIDGWETINGEEIVADHPSLISGGDDGETGVPAIGGAIPLPEFLSAGHAESAEGAFLGVEGDGVFEDIAMPVERGGRIGLAGIEGEISLE